MEGLTVDRGRRAIENLLALLPQKALIRVNGGFEEVAIDRLRVDQIVNIRPAEEIPVDGIVILGHSTIDQTSITSESKPVEKIVGSTAFAGTTLLGAIGRAAQGGAIVQGGRSMEALGTIDTIILDKTGTLTFAEPYVVGVVTCPRVDPSTVWVRRRGDPSLRERMVGGSCHIDILR